MSSATRGGILVIGIGNSDRGDDGAGPAVLSRLRQRLPAGVSTLECRDDVLDLIDYWSGFAAVFVIDAAGPAGRPGRIDRLDLIGGPLPSDFALNSTHALGLAETVELARTLNRLPRCLVAFLIEGEHFDIGAAFSPAVAEAVERVSESLFAELSSLVAALSIEGEAGHA